MKGIEREREKEREGKAKEGDNKSWERRNSNDGQEGGEVETGRYRTEVGKTTISEQLSISKIQFQNVKFNLL